MILSKAEIARVQIEKAVYLYVIEKDYVCAITLAGAAEELLGSIIKEQGGKSVIGDVYEEFIEEYNKFSMFSYEINNIRNELKHSHKNPSLDYEINIGEDDCAIMLYRALANYAKAVGEPTLKMTACWTLLKRWHEEIFPNSKYPIL
ncbi:hypothetical protein [Moritella sp.]|uniref:hypothetical protein n=1 Tax=Moritella sp. TaxID=78556 RepID=UPI0025F2CB68|nr:hypothetical protein [Moritella sp.]MCJ8352015.1 hypothetical protein [Moritella sp.]